MNEINVIETFHGHKDGGGLNETHVVSLNGEEVFRTVNDKYAAYMFAAELKLRAKALEELQKNIGVGLCG